eukprot:PhF_6_TR40396/c0_g1_i1/m.60183/K14575/AFG2, DRG1, SPATA5; AAA family ATPase
MKNVCSVSARTWLELGHREGSPLSIGCCVHIPSKGGILTRLHIECEEGDDIQIINPCVHSLENCEGPCWQSHGGTIVALPEELVFPATDKIGIAKLIRFAANVETSDDLRCLPILMKAAVFGGYVTAAHVIQLQYERCDIVDIVSDDTGKSIFKVCENTKFVLVPSQAVPRSFEVNDDITVALALLKSVRPFSFVILQGAECIDLLTHVRNHLRRQKVFAAFPQTWDHLTGWIDFNATTSLTVVIVVNNAERFFSKLQYRNVRQLLNSKGTYMLCATNVTLLHDKLQSHSNKTIILETPPKKYTNQKTDSWKNVGGLEKAKLDLQQAVLWPLKHPSTLRMFRLDYCRGVLLYGPPGCGKTSLVRALAADANVSMIHVDSAGIFSSYVGSSEEYLRNVFVKARAMTPCVVFFDEVEAIAGTRSGRSGSNDVGSRLLSTLLTEMDGVSTVPGVIFIGATNLPDKLDPAVTRPGRFDKIVSVPLPDETSRIEIIRCKIQQYFAIKNSQT